MPTRRAVLGMLAGGTASLLVPVPSRASDGSYDVSYLWAPDLDAVLDYRDEVAGALGPEVARDLTIVRGRSGNWGLIYDRKGTDLATARKVAAAHDRLLRGALGGNEPLATTIRDEGYTRSHNVAYGAPTSLAKARERFDVVARMLGPDVHSRLVIEEPSAGAFVVVYKRHGDAAGTAKVAARHAALLRAQRIDATVVPERHLVAVWGSASSEAEPAAVAASAPSGQSATGGGVPVAAAVGAAMTGVQAATKVVAHREADAPAAAPAPAAPPAAAPNPSPAAEAPRAPSALALPAAVATPVRDAINAHVQDLRRRGLLAADETTSWYVHALDDDRTWVALNAERELQCASMMKPYVALAFLHKVEDGELTYDDEAKLRLASMIQRSSNTSTNWAIAKVGGPAAVQKLLTTHYGELFPETRIVEAIPPQGRTYKNRSSARDYVRFSRAMWRGDLARSEEIKRLMGLPSRDRLITGAPSIPAGTKVHNKTGSTSHLCGDFGVIVAKKRGGGTVPYAFVGIIEKRSRASSYGAWISARSAVIRSVSDLTYRELKKHYELV